MAFGRRKKDENKKVVVTEITNEDIQKKILADDSTTDVKETKNEEIKMDEPKERKLSIKKNAKIIANGRCFGSSLLECPMKTVRNYETKILDIDKEHNSILIDEGWISINNIK